MKLTNYPNVIAFGCKADQSGMSAVMRGEAPVSHSSRLSSFSDSPFGIAQGMVLSGSVEEAPVYQLVGVIKKVSKPGKLQVGDVVKNREGLDVRILCVDRSGTTFPVVALTKDARGNEYITSYTAEGKYRSWAEDSDEDLLPQSSAVEYVPVAAA